MIIVEKSTGLKYEVLELEEDTGFFKVNGPHGEEWFNKTYMVKTFEVQHEFRSS